MGIDFPIQLVYNTEQVISIDNFDGLGEIANSQSSVFFIKSIVFPFTANIDSDEPTVINNLDEYSELLDSCNIPSLRNTLLEKSLLCFELEYPLTILNTSSEEEVIESDEDFTVFLEGTNSDFILEFLYPITVNEDIEINNNFELYNSLNSCTIIDCLEIDLDSEEIDTNLFTFEVEVDPLQQNTISWSINGEIQLNEIGTIFDHQFFNTDTYEVCVTVLTANEACIEPRIICETITIDCPTFGIANSTEDDREYLFSIDNLGTDDESFDDLIDVASIVWTVQQENNAPLVFNRLGTIAASFEFPETGTYEICVTSDGTDECEIDLCTTINADICPIIEISEELIDTAENRSTFRFTASGVDREYLWDLSEGFDPDAVSGDNGEFLEVDFSNGSHEICVSVASPECSRERVEVCIQIQAEGE